MLRLLLRGRQQVAEVIAAGGCAAPDLIRYEVANALSTNVRAGLVSADKAEALFERFEALPIEIVDSERLAAPALKVAMSLPATAYDAAYLVLAGQRGALLLTADRRLARLAKRSQVVD